MSNIISFNFEENAVRLLDRNGTPWFVLADVCRVLEIGNSRDASARLDDDEKTTLETRDIIDSIPGCSFDSRVQSVTIINECGLYSLILTSRKPAAKRFKKWVTAEVLPTIRKTGSYNSAPAMDPMQALNDPATMRGLLLNYAERNIALETVVQEQAPTIAAFDRIANADGSMCITDAAKVLQMRRNDLTQFLRQERWIYSRPGKPGYLAYQDKLRTGYLEHKVAIVPARDGGEKTVEQVRVTSKGLTKLATMMAPDSPPSGGPDDLFGSAIH